MKIQIGDHGVYLDEMWVPAVQVHMDVDANEKRARFQIVLDLAASDVEIDFQDAKVRIVNAENPRERAGT